MLPTTLVMRPKSLSDICSRVPSDHREQFVKAFVQVAAGTAARKVGKRRFAASQTLQILQVIVNISQRKQEPFSARRCERLINRTSSGKCTCTRTRLRVLLYNVSMV